MRLEGTLDAFSLPDIFQLLSFTKKTGGLHLRRADASGVGELHGVVHFVGGAVAGGSPDLSRLALVRRLVGAGYVDDAGLADALDAVRGNADVSVVRALLQAGALDEEDLHDVAREQAVDTVYDLLRWPEGDFAFVVDEPDPDGLGVALAVEDVVTEARRRLEAWEQLSSTVPAPEVVLAVPMTPTSEPTLTREEWALLALVDGRRSVGDLVTLTGRGQFGVVNALADLIERGLLVVRGSDEGVEALLRRQDLLAELEGRPVAPAAPARASSPAAQAVAAASAAPQAPPAARQSAPERPARDDDFAAAALAAAAVAATPAARSPQPSAVRAEESVIPARPEPFTPRRRPEHPDEASTIPSTIAPVIGTAAVAHDPVTSPSGLIERDPSVNKSLLLRLIAGVRGL